MKTNGIDIADFYRQISLLLKSGLPLSDSIEELGMNFDKPDFKEVLIELSNDTSKGYTLANAMKNHREYFTDFHIRMVEAGEETEMLPETLSEIAKAAHLNIQLTAMVREIALYPIFALGFAFTIVFVLFSAITPKFARIFEEMLGGEPLPPLTQFTMFIGNLFIEYQIPFIIAMVCYVLFFIWLFGGSITARRFFIRIISCFPGAGTIFYNLNMARLCAMWSVLMKQKITASEAFDITRSLIDNRKISSALETIAKSANFGTPLVDAIERETIISSMIPLTVKHVPEKELPNELAQLAILFRERASTATRQAGGLWAIYLIFFLAAIVGSIVIGMFLPLISIVKQLGGG